MYAGQVQVWADDIMDFQMCMVCSQTALAVYVAACCPLGSMALVLVGVDCV